MEIKPEVTAVMDVADEDAETTGRSDTSNMSRGIKGIRRTKRKFW